MGMLLAAATAARAHRLFRGLLRRFLGGGFLGDLFRRLGYFLHGFLRYFFGHGRISLKGFGRPHYAMREVHIDFADHPP